MQIELPSGIKVHFIGDPHAGRKFETGVPHHRRGEREERQLAKLKAELEIDCDVNICVGDVFDHPQVALAVVLEVADAFLAAAARHPDTDFFIMAGNHDRSRQLNTVGAWEIFARLVEKQLKNLYVVDTPGQSDTLAFFPWEWGVTAVEQVERAVNIDWSKIELVTGHWDFESFGGSGDHVVPTKLFPAGVKIVSGHYHLEGVYKVDGIDVDCTGSLEPYTHAEDPNSDIYVTLTLDEFERLEADTLVDKCVRILLRTGEELPVGLDCYALTAKRVADDEVGSVADKIGAFDWQEILDECLKDVPRDVRAFIDERLHPA